MLPAPGTPTRPPDADLQPDACADTEGDRHVEFPEHSAAVAQPEECAGEHPDEHDATDAAADAYTDADVEDTDAAAVSPACTTT